MSVELEPTELGFKRPFTHEVSQVLRLHNPHSQPVAFKVKTTAPKQYCVRPNSGRIEAGRDVEVQVLLQAMKEDPPADARCKDKFLVQSVAVDHASDASNVTQIWAGIEQTAKSSIQEKKIRVNFLPADGTAGTTTSAHTHDTEPPSYSSPNSPIAATFTPQRQTTTAGRAVSEEGDKSYGDARDSANSPSTQQSTLGAAAAAVSSVIPTSQDDLKRQLDAANAKISQLQQQATEGLRQRKSADSGEKSISSSSTSMQHAPAPGGVPVQIVAALCLLCFVIAYLFF